MSQHSEVLKQSLEQLAETELDITLPVYQRFEAVAPDACRHLAVMDERMRGRMLEQVINLLMGETEDEYLDFETRMHRGYGASPALYRDLFQSVKHVVREELGNCWSAQQEVAWDDSIDHTLAAIEHAYSS